MSHHLDTPLARQSGQLFIDDLYVFGGDGCTDFVMDVNSNITEPNVTPGFSSDARYEFRIHFDGADFEELTYRVAFDPMADGQQAFQVYELTGADARGDDGSGRQVATGRTGEVTEAGNVRVWAGRINDPFYIDLDELGVINAAVRDGTKVDLSKWRSGKPNNTFAGSQVYSIVLEVSHDHPRLRPGAKLGVWCATKLATDAGGWRQINRFGLPMMWPIFWPADTDFSNPANDRHPSEDRNADGKYIAEKIAAVVAANGTSADPEGYGYLVSHRIFPEVMPYTVGTPASFGFSGVNGRTLADNAPEAMFSMVLDSATSSGLDPSVAADMRRDEFPWVVPAS
ncbi:uncharacterized protein DUF4331 [Asanoa ferruginea]|uniref:Uncharacterized protein DUF4331 n=1 Tax=Asanoa ferruginea TaxID=53367 RepID=A0A3D9ZMD0_9ACTN|nr:DUF4331 family protein [Asanoa ferruginea]REF98528.1 uncharacterized protein DUF4331 [Asanoa ferruginea]GIF53576.1 hypothetical protein Afe04nite_81150 [Asanoa ferruginea]